MKPFFHTSMISRMKFWKLVLKSLFHLFRTNHRAKMILNSLSSILLAYAILLAVVIHVSIPRVVAKPFDLTEAEEMWLKFTAKYKTSYASPVEREQRKAIFMANLKLINKHNEEADEGLHSFKMSMNKFADLVSCFECLSKMSILFSTCMHHSQDSSRIQGQVSHLKSTRFCVFKDTIPCFSWIRQSDHNQYFASYLWYERDSG